jgi:hypothetical protein
MDVHHDQEQRHHAQHRDEQRGEKPGMDLERPIHDTVTYPALRAAMLTRTIIPGRALVGCGAAPLGACSREASTYLEG